MRNSSSKLAYSLEPLYNGFHRALVRLERIQLGPSSSSLAITEWRDAVETGSDPGRARHAIAALTKFGSSGATDSKGLAAYKADTGQSKSTFVRAIRVLKESAANRQEGAKYSRYQRTMVSVSIRSPGRVMTPGDSVTSPPSLGRH